jgi:ubiquitin-conjugating enzyme E2 S
MATTATMNENISPAVVKRIAKEMSKLVQKPIEDITVHMNDEDLTDIQATLVGPSGTPYEGGHFRMKLVLSSDFPQSPPKGFFITKIFHPNVSSSGEICVNTLKRDWKPEYGVEHILTVVKCLLIHPNPESALNEEAGKLLLEQYEEFAAHAKMMTEVHALPAGGAKPGLAASSSASCSDKGEEKPKKKKTTAKKRALKRL